MKRPFGDKRIIGPLAQFGNEPDESQIEDEIDDSEPVAEIRNGPIWTWVEVTTFAGADEESPEVTRKHVDFVDSQVKRMMTSAEVKERLDFAGDLKRSDIFCDSYGDLTVSCFIRHPEDFMSVRFLDEVIDVLQPNINQHKDLTMRDYRVVTEDFVEDRDPLIV